MANFFKKAGNFLTKAAGVAAPFVAKSNPWLAGGLALASAFGGGDDGGGSGGASYLGYNSPNSGFYDESVRKLLESGTMPSGIPNSPEFTLNGSKVTPGAMTTIDYTSPLYQAPKGFDPSALQGMLDKTNTSIDQLMGQQAGYTQAEQDAMSANLDRLLGKRFDDSMRRISGSMANRGLRGGTMTNAQLLGQQEFLDQARQGGRDILLGSAEARRTDMRDLQSLRNQLLQSGIQGAGNLTEMQNNYGLDTAKLGEGARQFDASQGLQLATANAGIRNQLAADAANAPMQRFQTGLDALLRGFNATTGTNQSFANASLANQGLINNQGQDMWNRNNDIMTGAFNLADRFGLLSRSSRTTSNAPAGTNVGGKYPWNSYSSQRLW